MCATNQQFDCHTSPLKVQDVLSDDDLHRLHCLVDKNESLSETLVLLDSLVEKPAINDEECNCLIQALEKIQCYTDQPIDITIKANLNICKYALIIIIIISIILALFSPLVVVEMSHKHDINKRIIANSKHHLSII